MIKDAFEVIDSMSAITRYSQAHNITRESVLEHTAFVAIFSMSICARVGHDPSTVLKRAAVHDIDEIITGDIPTTTKYANLEIQKAIREIEIKGAKKAITKLFTKHGDHIFEYWDDAKDDTIDGWILRIADTGAVVYKMQQEASLGNRTLLKYRQRIRKVFLEMIKNKELQNNGLADVVIELADILESI